MEGLPPRLGPTRGVQGHAVELRRATLLGLTPNDAMRISLIPAAALLALAAATGARGAETARARPRPNVLLIVMDTVRADRLSCYGYP
jgi:hypothetical protein